MPMDGLTLGFAARELNDLLAGGRVDRVAQPEKDTVILLCRVGGVNRRLLLCASAQNARCHLTQRTYPNPLEPPMFCMLLRKQLLGGRVLAVRQLLGDRVIHVDIEAVDELGDRVLRRLVLEVMGRHSNLILVDHNGRILDSAHHVSEDMSRVRQLMPGIPYEDPPAQDKLAPEACTAEALLTRFPIRAELEKRIRRVMTETEQDPSELIRGLVSAGYERVPMVEGKGQCSLRGEILDVFPPVWKRRRRKPSAAWSATRCAGSHRT